MDPKTKPHVPTLNSFMTNEHFVEQTAFSRTSHRAAQQTSLGSQSVTFTGSDGSDGSGSNSENNPSLTSEEVLCAAEESELRAPEKAVKEPKRASLLTGVAAPGLGGWR